MNCGYCDRFTCNECDKGADGCDCLTLKKEDHRPVIKAAEQIEEEWKDDIKNILESIAEALWDISATIGNLKD